MVAGVLGVRLEKPGTYVLGAEGESPSPATLTAARKLVGLAALFAAVTTCVVVLATGSARGVWDPIGWPW